MSFNWKLRHDIPDFTDKGKEFNMNQVRSGASADILFKIQIKILLNLKL